MTLGEKAGRGPEEVLRNKKDLAAAYSRIQKGLTAFDSVTSLIPLNERTQTLLAQARRGLVREHMAFFLGLYEQQETNPTLYGIRFEGTDYGDIEVEDYSLPDRIISWEHLPDYAHFREFLDPPKKP